MTGYSPPRTISRVDPQTGSRKLADMPNDDRYRWLYRNCPALMASIDAEGRYVDMSEAYLARLGFTRDELVGRRPQEHMTPEAARRMTEEHFPQFLRSGVLRDVPMDRMTKDGEVVEFLMNAIAERDADGGMARSIAVFVEQIEPARVDRHRREAYRHTPAMLHTTSLDARVEAVSDYWLDKLGYSRDEVLGAPVLGFLTERSRAQAARRMPVAFETGRLDEERLDFVRKDGGILEGLVSARADRDDEGAIQRMLVAVHDVTERNRAEAEKNAAFEEIARLNEELRRERDYLREEVKVALNFGQIIGSSAAIERVLKQVELVAPTDANIMIFGESGTGKELIASAIHEQSERRDGPMVRVNCGAIPRELFESEFFGHVKGSFTGALKDRVGRFQRADGGTLFLDEVGEIPLDLQSKLLRVLQEGELERVGDDRTRKVNVRVVAATNRDLKAETQSKRFREDLYFRLNVVPIDVPPLRERPEDIPQLAGHFVEIVSQQLKRSVPRLTEANLLELQRYDWPGNIRELQNVIERAVILLQGSRLRFGLPEAVPAAGAPAVKASRSLSSSEALLRESDRKERDRDAIIAALERAGGKVAGRGVRPRSSE